jgi:hypothetical protein
MPVRFKQECLEVRTERSTEPLFFAKEVTKINLIADHFRVSLTVKHNNHHSNKAIRPITIAANHEQEGHDKHHGHLIHGHLNHSHLIHGECSITISSLGKKGTGRLLHLFG